jgi:hypothetical protein
MPSLMPGLRLLFAFLLAARAGRRGARLRCGPPFAGPSSHPLRPADGIHRICGSPQILLMVQSLKPDRFEESFYSGKLQAPPNLGIHALRQDVEGVSAGFQVAQRGFHQLLPRLWNLLCKPWPPWYASTDYSTRSNSRPMWHPSGLPYLGLYPVQFLLEPSQRRESDSEKTACGSSFGSQLL